MRHGVGRAARARAGRAVEVEGRDGLVGVGEAAPLEPYDGVPLDAVLAALRAYVRRCCEAGDDVRGDHLYDRCREIVDLPQALAAVDMALWDLVGKRRERPISALMTDARGARVRVNATIGAVDRGPRGGRSGRGGRAPGTAV